MPTQRPSAGLLMYRRPSGELEVFLVHPGGPFWVRKDKGVWTVPKGQINPNEPPLAAAMREFQEETGFPVTGDFIELGTVKQASGKVVSVWAFEGDCDPTQLTSNLCRMEWPPRSGRQLEFPEIDRGRWFSLAEARESMLPSQQPFLALLAAALSH